MASHAGERTRVLKQPQSRDGCFTCKARRVKCDTTKPTCLRCIKGHRQCGYPGHSQPDSRTPLAGSDVVICYASEPHFKDRPLEKMEALRFVDLACRTLHYTASTQGGAAAPFWSFTVPQLSHNDSVVGAAAAALGAALDLQSSTVARHAPALLPWYLRALRSVRNAIDVNQPVSPAIVAATLLLAITEILAGHELFALSHLKGALALLAQRQHDRKAGDPSHGYSRPVTELVRDEAAFKIIDELDAAGTVLDISTATYALGLEPRLPALSASVSPQLPLSNRPAGMLEMTVLRALHLSYRFAAKHHSWRYVRHSARPEELAISQSVLAEQLFRDIEDLKAPIKALQGADLFRAHVLSAQCISCLIYIARLFEPEETSYDRFTDHFATIVSHVGVLQDGKKGLPTVHNNISLDLGCVQPLYFTAVKCREPRVRRHAIHLLLVHGGRDGPFDAKQHAAAACHAMELEERAAGAHVYSEGSSAASIPEGVRLHGSGIDGAQTSHLPPGCISVAFSRCRDVEGMMSQDSVESFKDNKWWDIWNETLSVAR